MTRQTRSQKSGFTLIELLVVIAIIAILAAILFPVFAQAREKARQISCLSNQKQIGLGIFMYVQDYDETYPMNQYYVAGTPNVRYTWADMVYPYIKNGEAHLDNNGSLVQGKGGIWKCPSFPRDQDFNYGIMYQVAPDGAVPWNWTQVPSVVTLAAIDAASDRIIALEKGAGPNIVSFDIYDGGYGNWVDRSGPQIGANGENQDTYVHLDIDQVKSDASQYYDTHDCDYAPKNLDNPGAWDSPWDGCNLSPRYRHNGVANVIFFDGHAKSMNRGRINWWRNVRIPGINKGWSE